MDSHLNALQEDPYMSKSMSIDLKDHMSVHQKTRFSAPLMQCQYEGIRESVDPYMICISVHLSWLNTLLWWLQAAEVQPCEFDAISHVQRSPPPQRPQLLVARKVEGVCYVPMYPARLHSNPLCQYFWCKTPSRMYEIFPWAGVSPPPPFPPLSSPASP